VADLLDPVVDYVTERQARALRTIVDASKWVRDVANMTLRTSDAHGPVVITEQDATRFMYDWERSGAWSLRGWGAVQRG
jgi:hypothetical protein